MRVVTAAVVIEGGRLFLARRPPGDALAGMWELPGGKVEPGESPEECLARELLEELQMESVVGELRARTEYHYDHGAFEMLAFAVERRSEFSLLAHDLSTWAAREDLETLRLAPADVNLVRQLINSGFWR